MTHFNNNLQKNLKIEAKNKKNKLRIPWFIYKFCTFWSIYCCILCIFKYFFVKQDIRNILTKQNKQITWFWSNMCSFLILAHLVVCNVHVLGYWLACLVNPLKENSLTDHPHKWFIFYYKIYFNDWLVFSIPLLRLESKPLKFLQSEF